MSWTCSSCGRKFKRDYQSHSCALYDKENEILKYWNDLYARLVVILKKRKIYFEEFVTSTGVLWRTKNAAFADFKAKKTCLELSLFFNSFYEDRAPLKMLRLSSRSIMHTFHVTPESDLSRIADYILDSYENKK